MYFRVVALELGFQYLTLKLISDRGFADTLSVFVMPAKHSGTKGSLCPASVCVSVCLSGSHTFLVVTHSYVSQGDTCIPQNAATMFVNLKHEHINALLPENLEYLLQFLDILALLYVAIVHVRYRNVVLLRRPCSVHKLLLLPRTSYSCWTVKESKEVITIITYYNYSNDSLNRTRLFWADTFGLTSFPDY